MQRLVTTTPERLDEEIEKYAALLSDLRSQKNSLLPIFRIPPEILSDIFTYGARDYYGKGLYDICVPDWVNVSYVCRHWRHVALDCPALWTYHFTVSPRWTEEILARSKRALLRIHVKCSYNTVRPWLSRLVEKVLNHAERIQELRLDIPGYVLPTEPLLNAPYLQILDVRFWGYPSGQTLTINNGDPLPLHTLKLSQCLLSWHSSLDLSGVTTLHLHCIPSLAQQSVTEFLTTLSRMQALTLLHLEDALPSSRSFLSSEAFGVSQRVSLSRLHRFFVHAPLSTVVALLSHMNMPLKTQVRLKIEIEGNSSIDDYAQLSSALAHRFSPCEDPTSSGPAIRSLVMNVSDDWGLTFGASERSDCDSNLSQPYILQDYNIPLFIHVSMTLWMISSKDRIVSNICSSIPSTHVQTLHVIDPPFYSDFWRKILVHLDGLRHLKLSKGYMPDLVSLLAPRVDGSVDATSSDRIKSDHAFAPALEELELDYIKFSLEDDLSNDAVSEQSLLDAVSTRKALHLTMNGCRVRFEDSEDGSDICQYCGHCRSEL